MPEYTYKCPQHGFVPVFKPMAEAGRKEFCPTCETETAKWARANGYVAWSLGPPMARVFNPQPFIMRPSGYHLGPQDQGYFTGLWRERELGELRDAPQYTDQSVDNGDWAGITTEEVNRAIPEQMHQELSEWCQANVPT